jgi:hypothetical protein
MRNALIFAILTYTSWAFATLPQSYIAVAGRSGSTITLLDSATGDIVKSIGSLDIGFDFEPMYVSHLKASSLFVVGDRKSNQVLFFDDVTAKFLGKTTVSKGVFHQWHNPTRSQLAIVGDADQTVDILQFQRHTDTVTVQRRVFNVPSEYQSGVPHDVVFDNDFFYVSIKGANINGKKGDFLLQVNTETLEIKNERTFSPDIHLGLPLDTPYLLVVEQATGQLNYLNKNNLSVEKVVSNLPGAHGLFWKEDVSQVFVANITATIDRAIFEIVNVSEKGLQPMIFNEGSTSHGSAHNVVVDFSSQLLFATHSGSQSVAVSIFDISNGIKPLKVVDTAANPFGIAIIQR